MYLTRLLKFSSERHFFVSHSSLMYLVENKYTRRKKHNEVTRQKFYLCIRALSSSFLSISYIPVYILSLSIHSFLHLFLHTCPFFVVWKKTQLELHTGRSLFSLSLSASLTSLPFPANITYHSSEENSLRKNEKKEKKKKREGKKTQNKMTSAEEWMIVSDCLSSTVDIQNRWRHDVLSTDEFFC